MPHNRYPFYRKHIEVLCFNCNTPTDLKSMEDTMPREPVSATVGLDLGRYYQKCAKCGLFTFYNIVGDGS